MVDADVLERARSHPVLVPGLLGFVVGVSVWLLGLNSGSWLEESIGSVVGAEIAVWLLGTIGSVVAGATAAWLTAGGLRLDVRNAALADLVSTTLFFLGFVAMLSYEAWDPSQGVPELLVSFLGFAVAGSVLGSPLVLLTLAISVVSGAATSHALDRRRGGPEPAGTLRK